MLDRIALVVCGLTLLACGGDDAGGSAAKEKASCAAWDRKLQEACGSDPGFEEMLCEESRLQYEPIGCGAELAEWYRCSTASEFDCDDGPTNCSEEIYLQCQSRFVGKTGCTRLPSMDEECASEMYAFGCLGALPAGCSELDSGGSGATFGCCPSFAPQGASYFE